MRGVSFFLGLSGARKSSFMFIIGNKSLIQVLARLPEEHLFLKITCFKLLIPLRKSNILGEITMAEHKRIALTVPPELHQVLNTLAELNDCTVTSIITEILKTSKPHLEQTAVVLSQLRAKQEELAIESIQKLIGGLSHATNQAHIEYGLLRGKYEGAKDANKKK